MSVVNSRLEERYVRELIRESLLSGRMSSTTLQEKVSMSAPAGETIKDALEEFELAGIDIDDVQLGLDMLAMGTDVASLAIGVTGIGAPLAAGIGLVGATADMTNAVVYATRGKWFDAVLSFIASAPGAGMATKGVKKIGSPVVQYVVVPAMRNLGSATKLSPKQIKTLVGLIDPSVVKKMKPSELLALQRRIDKASAGVMPILNAIKKGDLSAFAKAKGLKVPSGPAGKVAEATFRKLVNKAAPVIDRVIDIIKFLSDETLMRPLAEQLKAVKSGKKTLAVQRGAERAAEFASGSVGKSARRKRTRKKVVDRAVDSATSAAADAIGGEEDVRV